MKSISHKDIFIIREIMFIIALYFKNLKKKFLLLIQIVSNIKINSKKNEMYAEELLKIK